MPTNPSDELTKAVTKLAGRIPQIAALFGIEAPAQKPRARPSAQRRRLRRSRLHLRPAGPAPAEPAAPAAGEEE